MAGPLEGDVTIPHIGKLPKIAVAGGVAIVIVLIIAERRKQAAAASGPAAATASTASGFPPDGTTGNPSDPNSIDPATGQTYGAEGGGAGVADTGLQNSATWPWDGTYNNSSDPYSLDSATGLTYGSENGSYGGGGGSGGGTPAGPPFTTNAAWSQYVLNYFTANSYSDIGGRTDAIGLYLAGQQVNAAQAQYIHDATAVAGTPPVTGPGNFPPSIKQGGGQGGTVTVPNVVGLDVEQATQILSAAGLHVHGPAGVKNVVHVVTKQSPGSGAHVQRGTLVTLTTKNVTEHPPKKPAHH